jgi:CRISPR/Cas system-associated endonuclease Cas1
MSSHQLTGSPRLAANPINSLLNQTYAILEASNRGARRGLRPGLGVLHADQPNRERRTRCGGKPLRAIANVTS